MEEEAQGEAGFVEQSLSLRDAGQGTSERPVQQKNAEGGELDNTSTHNTDREGVCMSSSMRENNHY